MTTDRDRWLAERRSGIGGSDAAACLGVSPWKSRYTLWAEKTGRIDGAQAETLAMRLGLLLEPVVLELYQQDTGREVALCAPHQISRAKDRPWQLATFDGLQDVPFLGLGVVQLKTTGAAKGGDWTDEPPLHYQVQIQHEIDVAGVEWGTLVCLVGNQRLAWFDVERNDAFIRAMRKAEEDFWGHVQRDDPPPVDHLESTTETLAKLHPADNGEVVSLPDEAALWTVELAQADAELAKLNARRDELRNKLRAAIGDATFGELPDGSRWSWKTQTRAGYVVAPSTTRVLRRCKQ